MVAAPRQSGLTLRQCFTTKQEQYISAIAYFSTRFMGLFETHYLRTFGPGLFGVQSVTQSESHCGYCVGGLEL